MAERGIMITTSRFKKMREQGVVYIDKTALKQIDDKGYAIQYEASNKKVIKIGTAITLRPSK